MCPDTMEGDIESHSSAGVVIVAVPIGVLPRPCRPVHLLAAPSRNQVVIPDRMVTAVKNGSIITECKAVS
eukprot:CAMPEP_0184328700 /NCGR_PEP_ID=MMETSP1049-20130417/143760_1 /TAXON_ID=77928 /ORGANISM="Proteomonas sulcata, Strain CCMP704" /LENGTH=69 /DNA_ID=CAMNT_0026651025 /DNA_START=43 /DNA_END=252 /DNA_ORIENTATION=-